MANSKNDQESRLRNIESSAWQSSTLTSKVSSFGGSNPTFSNVDVDNYFYKEMADGDLRVRGEYKSATASGSAGSSSYEISLPAGYEFDTDIVSFETDNGDGSDGRGAIGVHSGIGACFMTSNTGLSTGSSASGMIVPTSPTTFRLASIYNRNTNIDSSGFWGSSWFDASIIASLTFDGILPVKKV